MKRESINDSEAGMNEESLKPLVDDMLDSRREALKRINAQFGTNITVELNSAWVRREKISSDETTPEETSSDPKPEEDPTEEETEQKQDEEKGDDEK